MITEDIKKNEASLIEDYYGALEWRTIESMGKESLSTLLLVNYAFSKSFGKILNLSLKHSKHPETLRAISHIHEEEQIPYNHMAMHRDFLIKCGLEPDQSKKYTTRPGIKKLLDMSMGYAKPSSLEQELGLLCFFRLAEEILAGKLYQVLADVISTQFGLRVEDIDFVTIHGEHDISTAPIGTQPQESKADSNFHAHADFFNEPIVRLAELVGKSAEQVILKAQNDAFSARSAFLKELVC